MKQQIIIIHGGSSYDTYEEYISDLKAEDIDIDDLRSKGPRGLGDMLSIKLGPDFDVILPEMPNWANAHYLEWKIWFEKIIPLLNDRPVILIGHSLGGIFLAKYLAENNFAGKIKNNSKKNSGSKIKALFLLAAPYKLAGGNGGLGDFVTPADLSKIQKQCDTIFIYHSKDDPVVDFASAGKYAAALPSAQLVVFEDKKHFNQPEFPELVRQIINL